MKKIKKMIENIKSGFRNFRDMVQTIKLEYAFYKGLWDKPEGKAAVRHLWKECLYLLEKIKPSKIEGNLIFGTEDPALTGQILGGIAIVYGCFPKKFQITPDFEEKRLEGTVHAKGKIRLIHVVIIAVRLWIDRNFRYIVKKIFAKEGAENEQ